MERLLQITLPSSAAEQSQKHPPDPHEPLFHWINACLCACLTESGHFILFVHYGKGRHLLAVKSLQETTALTVLGPAAACF